MLYDRDIKINTVKDNYALSLKLSRERPTWKVLLEMGKSVKHDIPHLLD